MTATDQTLEAVKAAVSEALGHAYDCGRVWGAWSHGTMGPDDFSLVCEDDERLTEIAMAALQALGNATDNPAASHWHQQYRDACQAHHDQVAALGARIQALEAHNAKLLSAVACAIEFIDQGVPEANCSCHISPPCNDCVEFAGTREVLEILNSAEVPQ